MSRADLIKTANMYFSGMQQNGRKRRVYPFTDDCNRIENGDADHQRTGERGPDQTGPGERDELFTVYGAAKNNSNPACYIL